MIIEAVLDLIFDIIKLPFNMINLPDVPSALWDNINTIHQYLSNGFRLCQYFFDKNMYNLFLGLFISLIVAKPTVKIFVWIYNKIRGC